MKTNILLTLFLALAFGVHAQTTLSTIRLQPDAAQGKDALLHGLYSHTHVNFGNNEQFAANAWTFQGTAGVVRSVVEFDLSAVPGGATITSAYLSFYAFDSSIGFGQHSTMSGSNACWIQRVTSSWDEATVCWNNHPTSTNVNQVSIPASSSPTEDYLDINVTQLVQDMIDHPASSFGFLLRLQNENYYRLMNFASSDHSNSDMHPLLVINYTIDNTSAEDINPAFEADIFPNPAKDKVHIRLSEQQTSPVSVQLFNASGQLTASLSMADSDMDLDLSTYADGMYILILQSEKGTLRKKIIIE